MAQDMDTPEEIDLAVIVAKIQADLNAQYGYAYEGQPNFVVDLNFDEDETVLVMVRENPPHDHCYNPAKAVIDFTLESAKQHIPYDLEYALDPCVDSAESVQGLDYHAPGGMD